MTTRILPRKEVERLTGFSRSFIYKLSTSGQFPRPVQLTERRIGWVESEVIDWIEQRVKARNAA